jgi:nitrous oxidase accessory protein NosD
MASWFLTALSCLVALLGVPAGTAGAGTVYYVAVNGADQDDGSDSQPWRTIGRAAAQVLPGDLVVVRAGTYSESVALTRSGQAGAPVVFRGLPGVVLASPDPTQSLSAFDVRPDVAYVTLQGFELGGGFAETVFVRPGAHHIELSGLHIHDNRTGIWIAGAADVLVRRTVIERNFRTGIRIFAGARRVRVLDTRAEANDDGLACGGDSDGFSADESTSGVSFERVSAIGNSEDGLDLQSPDATVLQAVVQDNGCSGIKVAAGAYMENALVERNRTGINIDGAPDAMTVIQNCTLSENDLGVRLLGAGHALTMRNSIVAGPAKALSYAATVQLIEHHNIFHRPLAKDRLIVRIGSNGETRYSANDINSGKWERESGQGRATVARDPGLVLGGCRLRGDSIGIDSGDDAGAPPLDLVDTARPIGARVDRGAFECGATAPRACGPRCVPRSSARYSERTRRGPLGGEQR